MKRIFDILFSILALTVLFLPILVVAIMVRLKLGKPIVFSQNRPGLNAHIFKMYKFRTMSDERDADGQLLPDEKRLPSFGKALRSTSLDELPALLNVIKGDLSLVGPRPLLVEYLPLYSDEQARRHLVKPGVTGWAQVNGRNAICWEQKFKFDVWYVENQTFLLDLKILYLTVKKVVLKDGIAEDGNVTMTKFTGNSNE